jgi:L-ascorbate metabolism protein UlaG (beta-lactamase superfamily)
MEKPDTLPTSAGPLTIQPVDHASLVLSQGDAVLYVDPVGGAARYAGLAPPTAILITHEHGDHFDTETLTGIAGTRAVPLLVSQGVFDKLDAGLKPNARPIGYGETTTLAGLPVRVVEAYNTTEDRLSKHPPGLGNGYVVGFGDMQVYIAGDTEPTPGMLALSGIGVAFLPMNLPYTMTGAQAADAVKRFKPRIVYPFHYGQGPEPEKFAGLMDGFPGVEVRQRDWYPG